MSTDPDQTDADASNGQHTNHESPDNPDADQDQPQLSEDSPLHKLFVARRRQLAQIEEDGERIKQVIGELVVGDVPDAEVAGDLNQIIQGTIGKAHANEEAVRLPEIIFALWQELDRATYMLTEATERTEEADEEDDDGTGAEAVAAATDDQSADPSVGGIFQ